MAKSLTSERPAAGIPVRSVAGDRKDAALLFAISSIPDAMDHEHSSPERNAPLSFAQPPTTPSRSEPVPMDVVVPAFTPIGNNRLRLAAAA